jgi:hypothetical protein
MPLGLGWITCVTGMLAFTRISPTTRSAYEQAARRAFLVMTTPPLLPLALTARSGICREIHPMMKQSCLFSRIILARIIGIGRQREICWDQSSSLCLGLFRLYSSELMAEGNRC